MKPSSTRDWGRVLMYLGGYAKEARAALRTGLDLDDRSVELHYLLADLCNRLREPDAAAAEYQTVLRLAPQHGAAHARLAVLAYYRGDIAAAWEHLRSATLLGADVPSQLEALLNGEDIVAPRSERSLVPVIGPQARMDVAGGLHEANETSMASVDSSPLEVIGSWNDYREDIPWSTVRMGVGVSLDGGSTWVDFLVRAPEGHQSGVEGDPMTCYDPRTGTLWVGAIAFGEYGSLYVARKNPGEATFAPSVVAQIDPFADKGWMAAGRPITNPNATNVYIAYNGGCVRSTDMGETWGTPVPFGYGLGFLPRVGPNGELYVAYWDVSHGVRLKRSFDDGESFTDHLIATRLDAWDLYSHSRVPGEFRIPEMTYLAVDPNGGTLYCIYFDTTNVMGGNYNLDLYFCKSTDQGTTWTSPVIINHDSMPPRDQFFPWIEVDQQGRLHVVSLDSRRTIQGDNDVHGWFDAYYTCSQNGGAAWSEYRLTPTPFDSFNCCEVGQFLGDYSGLGVAANRVYPCYLSTQLGSSDIFTNVIVWPGKGDLNCDGVIDFDDVDPFTLALGDPAGYAVEYPQCDVQNADCNDDGVLDFSDINPFVELVSAG